MRASVRYRRVKSDIDMHTRNAEMHGPMPPNEWLMPSRGLKTQGWSYQDHPPRRSKLAHQGNTGSRDFTTRRIKNGLLGST